MHTPPRTAGFGLGLSVLVVHASGSGTGVGLVSYTRPAMMTVTISNCTTYLEECLPRGGNMTITGTDFGTSGAIVRFNEYDVSPTYHDPYTPTTKLYANLLPSQPGQALRYFHVEVSGLVGPVGSSELLIRYRVGQPGQYAGPDAYAADDSGFVTCPDGYWSNPYGSSSCSICNAGSAAKSGGAGGCDSCPAGKIGVSSVPDCNNCTAGRYTPSDQSGVCFECRSGTYSAVSGTTGCESCDAGKFQSGYGGTNCTAVCFVSLAALAVETIIS